MRKFCLLGGYFCLATKGWMAKAFWERFKGRNIHQWSLFFVLTDCFQESEGEAAEEGRWAGSVGSVLQGAEGSPLSRAGEESRHRQWPGQRAGAGLRPVWVLTVRLSVSLPPRADLIIAGLVSVTKQPAFYSLVKPLHKLHYWFSFPHTPSQSLHRQLELMAAGPAPTQSQYESASLEHWTLVETDHCSARHDNYITSLLGAMDSNDSFSLAMDTTDTMAGFTGLAPHHGGHPGPLPPGLPHQLPPHYPDHYDQPNLPPHPAFNCGEFCVVTRRMLKFHRILCKAPAA